MNEPILINGTKPDAAIEGRYLVISETNVGQWQLKTNLIPRDVVVILLELAKMAALREMKESQRIEIPQMQVTS